MNEPNFDWNSSCTTLVTCLFNIKNWLLTTPGTVPITIYLEPRTYTYTTDNVTFASALAASNQTGPPDSCVYTLQVEMNKCFVLECFENCHTRRPLSSTCKFLDGPNAPLVQPQKDNRASAFNNAVKLCLAADK